MFSALSRVQIDTIDSSGMQVESVCRFDFSTSETLMDVVPSYFSSEICRQTSSETRPAQILPTQFLAFCSEASSRCRRWTGDGGLSWGGGYRTRVQSYLCASSVSPQSRVNALSGGGTVNDGYARIPLKKWLLNCGQSSVVIH
jgi:hypothetical protein